MGATFAKLDCSGCFRKNKIGVITNSQHSIIHRFETRPSSVIIQELQRIGIVSERSGGVKFFVETSESDKPNVKPRRLPALLGSSGLTRGGRTDKSRATTSKENDIHIYDKEEKGLMVEIRRIGALADKGKMAKESAKRRQEVIARKETRLKEKIQKIEDKLKRENQTAQKNITKPSKENRKPERKPRPNKPSVSGLPSVSV